jgi:uncharacterized protein HemX
MENNEEKKKTPWPTIMGIGVILLFGVRMYITHQQKKDREEEMQMMEELSRMQSEQFRQDYAKNMDSISATLAVNIDSIQRGLDSLGKKMKADQEAFEKKMKK